MSSKGPVKVTELLHLQIYLLELPNLTAFLFLPSLSGTPERSLSILTAQQNSSFTPPDLTSAESFPSKDNNLQPEPQPNSG